MNDCPSRTEPAQPDSSEGPERTAPDPRILAAFHAGYRAGARDVLAELTGPERATLLRQASAPKE